MFGTPKKAEKGAGSRNMDCEHYQACLDHAVKQNWQGFHCGDCNYPEGQGKESATATGKEPKALCADCLENETLGNSRYCASCMAIRGARKRAEAKATERPAESPKKKKPTEAKPESRKPASEPDTILSVDFRDHVDILRDVERLAKEELRPIEWQIIYMIRSQLRAKEQAVS